MKELELIAEYETSFGKILLVKSCETLKVGENILVKDKIYKNTEKPGYRSIDVRVFLLYYIIYRTADRVELRIVYRNKSKKT